MIKKILLLALLVSLVMELTLTFLCFFMPATAISLFGMHYNNETAFLGYIIAWFCLLVSALIVYSMLLLKSNNTGYKILINILGCWWVTLGVGVFIVFNKTDNLMLDSLKGLVLIGLNYIYQKEKPLINN